MARHSGTISHATTIESCSRRWRMAKHPCQFHSASSFWNGVTRAASCGCLIVSLKWAFIGTVVWSGISFVDRGFVVIGWGGQRRRCGRGWVGASRYLLHFPNQLFLFFIVIKADVFVIIPFTSSYVYRNTSVLCERFK